MLDSDHILGLLKKNNKLDSEQTSEKFLSVMHKHRCGPLHFCDLMCIDLLLFVVLHSDNEI